MKTTWVLVFTLGVVSAVNGPGYQYNVPHTSYGIPYQVNTNTVTSGTKKITEDISATSTGTEQMGQNTDIHNFDASRGGTVGSTNHVFTSNVQIQFQQQPPVVYKHFYVHAAPEEPVPAKLRTPIVLPPAQKHYKIIFVKVPSEDHRSQAVVPVQPQNEEKTIVYVLVKKPEHHDELIVPKVEQKPPSKPEVFFIKYKNKEDSQAVIENIVNNYKEDENVMITNTDNANGNTYNTNSKKDDQTSEQINEHSVVTNIMKSSSSADIVKYNEETINKATIASGMEGGYKDSGVFYNSQVVPHETYGPPKFRVE